MHAPTLGRAERAGLAHERLQRALASRGKDHLAYHAFRAANRGLGDALERRIIMRRPGRAEKAVKPVRAWAADSLAGKPAAQFAFKHRRRRFARQQIVGKPTSELRLGRIVERGDRQVVENEAPVPPSGPPGPFIAFEHIDLDADLSRQVTDDCRGKVSLLIRKAPVPPTTVAASVPPRPWTGRLRTRIRPGHPTWSKCTASRSLGHLRKRFETASDSFFVHEGEAG